jgi:hypothetical protein
MPVDQRRERCFVAAAPEPFQQFPVATPVRTQAAQHQFQRSSNHDPPPHQALCITTISVLAQGKRNDFFDVSSEVIINRGHDHGVRRWVSRSRAALASRVSLAPEAPPCLALKE